MSSPDTSVRVLATAPVRVADVGGWTDTWFGSPGRVCNVAVGPGVTVEVRLVPGDPVVRVDAPSLGPPWEVGTGPADGPRSVGDPLVNAAVREVLASPEPSDRLGGRGVEVSIRSAVPTGASLGTSASVLVALLASLDAAVFDRSRPAEDIAAWAHRVETDRARREAGVQDHWAAACGGVSLLDIRAYPSVRRTSVAVPAEARDELATSLVTVVVGAHDSSAVHREVIDATRTAGTAEQLAARRAFRELVRCADAAALALEAGHLQRWGEALVAATAAQASLHPGLVGPAHRQAIEMAGREGALGWKVNGAGGAGGSLTVLAPGSAERLAEVYRSVPGWIVADLRPAPGLSVR